MEKILLEAWEIPQPRFIVSIIGGAKYFKLNDRLETNFINGIIDIVEKSGILEDSSPLDLIDYFVFSRCLVIDKWI